MKDAYEIIITVKTTKPILSYSEDKARNCMMNILNKLGIAVKKDITLSIVVNKRTLMLTATIPGMLERTDSITERLSAIMNDADDILFKNTQPIFARQLATDSFGRLVVSNTYIEYAQCRIGHITLSSSNEPVINITI